MCASNRPVYAEICTTTNLTLQAADFLNTIGTLNAHTNRQVPRVFTWQACHAVQFRTARLFERADQSFESNARNKVILGLRTPDDFAGARDAITNVKSRNSKQARAHARRTRQFSELVPSALPHRNCCSCCRNDARGSRCMQLLFSYKTTCIVDIAGGKSEGADCITYFHGSRQAFHCAAEGGFVWIMNKNKCSGAPGRSNHGASSACAPCSAAVQPTAWSRQSGSAQAPTQVPNAARTVEAEAATAVAVGQRGKNSRHST